jgi:DNA processing protein
MNQASIEKSGSLHTANFALQQGKDVLAVPGNITNDGSVGTNNLIKAGATPVTSYLDVLHA